MNILIWLMIILGCTSGVLATIYLAFSIPVIIVWKIYRKCKYKIPLYD